MTTYHNPRTGMEALGELKDKLEVGILGFLAYRAGRNHYNVHGDLEEAIIYGAHALRRWWIWIFFVKVWLFSAAFTAWMLYLHFHDIRGESFQANSSDFNNVTLTGLIFLGPAALALAILYCRNVDYSLFKRRLVYKVLRPLVVVLDRVPAWGLYVIVPCILCFPTGWFVGDPAPTFDQQPSAFQAVCEQVNAAHDAGQTKVAIDDDILRRAGVGSDLQGWYAKHC